ncbi:NAD+ synthase [Limobrevibacterium gyesilva]|uniref:Glutamine-dependent NAD(+) synthetase n=1 Tax=Limobrevibacterium gyesilva TaxID=2991712 RepID=A0AA41YL84_9PROT|nr:NAD+ synthase [Limobrevibacterium gyesilva]MCW3475919.1 NAD+ synthase [Limobrevibacterium gyesilva]
MSDTLKIAIAQLNPHEGQVVHNLAGIRRARAEGARQGADLVVTPEFSIAGYPPEDLVRKPAFVAACEDAIAQLAADTADGGPGLIVGGPWRDGDKLYNAAFVLDGGKVVARRAKHELPNYGVFDDKRVFDPGPSPGPVPFRGWRIGVMICEDWWFPEVSETLAESGAELLLSINGSPYEVDKHTHRVALAVHRVVETDLPFVFAAQVCGQDELVFEGASFVLNADRSLAVQMPHFEEAVTLTEWRRDGERLLCTPQPLAPEPERLESIYRCMMLGLSDYVRKNRFPGVILGLSGGIDSALSAAVAVDALGPDMVRSFMLPSPYTGQDSLDDAAACASLLGIPCDSVSITPAMEAFNAALAPIFAGRQADITEENIQSRARGLILMAISNKLGHMVLTTGNKSEMSVGYATLYGDMCGGYSVLKDVYKTTVFELCHWRNANRPKGALGPDGPVMPLRVITKPPSAELKPNQTDQDSLPPYDELDAILQGLVEGEQSVDALVEKGFDRATILRVWKMLDRAEYKRRQAPPGVKITPRAFGRDRRYPITNGFTALIA